MYVACVADALFVTSVLGFGSYLSCTVFIYDSKIDFSVIFLSCTIVREYVAQIIRRYICNSVWIHNINKHKYF